MAYEAKLLAKKRVDREKPIVYTTPEGKTAIVKSIIASGNSYSLYLCPPKVILGAGTSSYIRFDPFVSSYLMFELLYSSPLNSVRSATSWRASAYTSGGPFPLSTGKYYIIRREGGGDALPVYMTRRNNPSNIDSAQLNTEFVLISGDYVASIYCGSGFSATGTVYELSSLYISKPITTTVGVLGNTEYKSISLPSIKYGDSSSTYGKVMMSINNGEYITIDSGMNQVLSLSPSTPVSFIVSLDKNVLLPSYSPYWRQGPATNNFISIDWRLDGSLTYEYLLATFKLTNDILTASMNGTLVVPSGWSLQAYPPYDTSSSYFPTAPINASITISGVEY